ncbi:MAG: alanine racemase [Acidimicrobiales bacterium]
MEALRLAQLAEVVGGVPAGPFDGERVVEAATIHSERIHRASAFFALPGSRTDGHRFVGEAFANGAVAAVVAGGRAVERAGPLVEVDDPLRALQDLAAWWRSQVGADVVAVVGSNGKTVTKDAIVHFAGCGRRVYGSPGSYNSQVGVPLAVLGIPRDCDVAVIEAAVSDPGEMGLLEAVVRPDHVVVTNLGTRWASRFGSRAEQAAELLVMARGASWVLVGEDDPLLAGGHLVTGTRADLPRFEPPVRLPEGVGGPVAFPDGASGSVVVRTPSDAVLQDVRTAITAAWLLGVGGPALLDAATSYRPTSTRLEIWRSPGGVTVVRDVATPDPIAAGAAVRAAARLAGPGQRCLVVLAEPLADPGPAFASALVAEGAAAVLGLDEPSHRRVAEALAGRLDVRLAAGAPRLRDLLLAELRAGDVVLVQSAPERSLGDLTVALMESMAPTRMYIDLAAVEDNVTAFRRLVGPSVRIMGMVKALAYGTDAPSVASSLQTAGVDALGVAGVDEGVALRRAGIAVPILVLLGTAAELPKMLRYRLTPLVYGPEMLEAVLAAGTPMAVHVEVDSGMHRTGLAPEAAVDAIRRLAAAPGVTVAGLMTHLASADDPGEDPATAEQLHRFRLVDAAVAALGVSGVVRHAAATAAAVRLPEARFDMVRIGLGLYGVHPSAATAALLELQCALGLVSRIVEVLDVPSGERVGYGGTFTAPVSGRRVGVVPAGYHDGVPRSASNAGVVVVAGVRCPIVGRVSMDSMAVDLTACPEAAVGTDVLVYGRQHDWSLPVEELAGSSGTIAHELMARLGPRVQRIFTRH